MAINATDLLIIEHWTLSVLQEDEIWNIHKRDFMKKSSASLSNVVIHYDLTINSLSPGKSTKIYKRINLKWKLLPVYLADLLWNCSGWMPILLGQHWFRQWLVATRIIWHHWGGWGWGVMSSSFCDAAHDDPACGHCTSRDLIWPTEQLILLYVMNKSYNDFHPITNHLCQSGLLNHNATLEPQISENLWPISWRISELMFDISVL